MNSANLPLVQAFEAGASWPQKLLGSFYPSLPRILECHEEGSKVHAILAPAIGEPVADYSQRLGPLPVGTACILVWRLAVELEALQTLHPEAVRFLDPMACQLEWWQQEFLQLTIGRFESEPTRDAAHALPSRLLELSRLLLNGNTSPRIDGSVAARVPTSLLMHLREHQNHGTTELSLAQVKGIMLNATAAVTRSLRGSNVMAQLTLNNRWRPATMEEYSAPVTYRRSEEARLPVSPVRLSRLLAHRHKLNPIEVSMLLRRLEEQASCLPETEFSLDPQHVFLILPTVRDAMLDKALDVRLDSLPEFSVALQTQSNAQGYLRSPIATREASVAGQMYADLRGNVEGQLSRLHQALQDGTYGLSSYDLGDSPRDLPGIFFCPLLNRPALPASELFAPKPEEATAEAESAQPETETPEPQAAEEVIVILSAEAAAPPIEVLSTEAPAAEMAAISETSAELPPVEVDVPAMESREDEAPAAAHVEPASIHPHLPFLVPSSKQSMKMILVTAGSGGTGKSTIARLIYELAQFDQRDDVAMFDCDALGNRDFQKIAPNRIESMPIDNIDSMRRLVESAMDDKLVLADLPASCQEVLARDLTPDIIQSLRLDEGLFWMPIHPVTAKAAAVPAIKQWRKSVFGDAPSVLVISLKDGPVLPELLDEIVRPQDTVLRMPVLDQSLAAALDAANCTWREILEGKAPESHRMFGNPLVKRQLRTKLKECQEALFPLLRRIANDSQVSSSPVPEEAAA